MTETPPRTVTTCGCRCHRYGAGTHVTCDLEHDTGASGVPGVPMCSPHDLDPRAATSGRSALVGEPCPGSCNRDWFRLAPAEQAHPDQPIRPRLGEPVWCVPCARRIARALAELPDLYAHLEADFAARTTDPSGGGHSRRAEAPSPSLQVDEQDALAAWLTDLEDHVRAERGFTVRPVGAHRLRDGTPEAALMIAAVSTRADSRARLRAATAAADALAAADLAAQLTPDAERPVPSQGRRDAVIAEMLAAVDELERVHRPDPTEPVDVTLLRVTRAVQFLAANLDHMLAGRLAVDRGVDIQRRAARLRAVTARDGGTVRHKKPCPRCDNRTLVSRAGEAHIECEHCGRLLTHDEYDRLGRSA